MPLIPMIVDRTMGRSRVEHQHCQRGARADAADERHRQQEAEHREARHRLDDVRDGHERRREPGAASREDAERHAHRHGDGGRDGHEQHVLADQRGQLLSMREPEADDVRHGLPVLDAGTWRDRDRVDERAHARVLGLKNGVRRAAPNQAARVDDADAIRKCDRLGHVVRDQEHRLSQPRLDAAELLLQLTPRDRVERAERLVHQQDRGIRGEGPRHADALALSARQLIGPPRAVVVVREPDQPEQFADARAHALVLPAFEPRHHGDVVGDGQVGEESHFLNDVAHASVAGESHPTPVCLCPARGPHPSQAGAVD